MEENGNKEQEAQLDQKEHIDVDKQKKMNYDDDNNGDVFAKYRRSDGKEITSTVFIETNTWYSDVFLLPHEPGEQQRWKITNFYNWYNSRFYPNLHGHHDVEEQILFPFIKTKMPMPERTTSDHKKLVQMLDTIKDMQRLFVDEASRNSDQGFQDLVQQLIATWDAFREHTLPHLAEEEKISIDFPKYFTQEEYEKQLDKMIQVQSFSALAKELPGIMEALGKWGNDEQMQSFLNKLPGPVKWLNNSLWKTAYLKYEREALASLRSDTENIIGPEPSYSACIIL